MHAMPCIGLLANVRPAMNDNAPFDITASVPSDLVPRPTRQPCVTMTRLAAVTRADRGIGLAMCKSLKAKGYHVIGACRRKSPALEELNLEIVEGGHLLPAGPLLHSTTLHNV